MPHIYLTGDTHGDADRIEYFCYDHGTTKDDLMIILGDVGCNYYGNSRDDHLKKFMESMPITFCLLRGNHEMRPPKNTYQCESIISPGRNAYGRFLFEPAYPSLLFMEDCEYYMFSNINGYGVSAYALGGAYSVDKHYRLSNKWQWFEDEQLSGAEMATADIMLSNFKRPDIILSHTCPFSVRPVDKFIPGIDQSTVDNTMELWMDKVNKALNYPRWYCGHWHVDRKVDNVRFLYNDFIEL